MTDLQVTQPVFTLVLHSLFPLRETRVLAIVGRRMGHSSLSFQAREVIVASKEIRTCESNDAARFTARTMRKKRKRKFGLDSLKYE
jgi:hypothetical protein